MIIYTFLKKKFIFYLSRHPTLCLHISKLLKFIPLVLAYSKQFIHNAGEKGNRAAIGIVPQELTEDNYEDWKICLKHYLVGHGLWGVVSGKEPEPCKDRKQEHDEWKRKNALALHAIQLSCGPGTNAKFKEAHICARVAWNHLAEKVKRPHKFKEHDHEDEHHVEDEGKC